MQVIWCLKFGNMTKSGGTIPPLQILGDMFKTELQRHFTFRINFD